MHVTRIRRDLPTPPTELWSSPISGISASSGVAPSRGFARRACFAAVAGAADVLAGSPIRGDLQAHLAVALVAEQPLASTLASRLDGTRTSILVTTGRLLYPPGAAEVGTNLRPDLARPVELSVARRASSSHASAMLVDQGSSVRMCGAAAPDRPRSTHGRFPPLGSGTARRPEQETRCHEQCGACVRSQPRGSRMCPALRRRFGLQQRGVAGDAHVVDSSDRWTDQHRSHRSIAEDRVGVSEVCAYEPKARRHW